MNDILFLYVDVLWLLIVLLPFLFIVSKKRSGLEHYFSKRVLDKIQIGSYGLSPRVRNILLTLSLAFVIIALARPYKEGEEIKVKSSFIQVVAGFDISNSMFANDVYPSRFEFAKQKFSTLLEAFENAKIAIVGFSSQAFLIAPMTNDYNSLKFLTANLSFDYVSLKGTSLMSALESANTLFEHKSDEKKAVLIFSDGGDKDDLSAEIEYAKANNISVFIYAIGTQKGGVIQGQNGVIKDAQGNIVVSKLNSKIKALALETGGAYLEHSLRQNDIKALSDAIKAKFDAKSDKESTIKQNKELFVYPLGAAVVLLFMSLFSLPGLGRTNKNISK
jgi:Ca-activated chloride channel family protein